MVRKIAEFEAYVQAGHRIVIPRDVRKELEIRPGDVVRVTLEKIQRVKILDE